FSPLDHIQPPPQAHSNRSPAPRQLPPQPKFRPEKPLDQDVVRLQLDQLREQLDKQSAPKVLSKPTMPRSWLAPKPSTARAALPPPCPALPPPPSTPNEENGWHDVSKSEWQADWTGKSDWSQWQDDWKGKSNWSQWQDWKDNKEEAEWKDDWKGKSDWSQWQDWKDNKEEAEWKDWKDKEEAEWKDDSKGKNGKNDWSQQQDDSKGKNGKNDWSQQQDDSKGKNGKNDWSQQQDDSKGKNGKNDWSQQQGWKDSEKEPETRKMSSQQMRSKSRSRSPSSREKRSAFQDKSDDPEDERKDDEREADDKDDKEWEQFYIRVMKMDMDEKRRRHSKVFDDKDEKVVVEEPVELPLEKTEIQEADDTVEPMELPEEPEPEEPADSEPEPSLPPRPALPALPPPPPPAPAVRAGPLSRVPRGLQPKGSQPPPEPKALPKVLPKAPKRGSASYKKDEAAKKEEEEESWIWPREDPRSKASRIAYADRFMTRAAAKARTMAKLTNFQCHCRGSLSDLGENKAMWQCAAITGKEGCKSGLTVEDFCNPYQQLFCRKCKISFCLPCAKHIQQEIRKVKAKAKEPKQSQASSQLSSRQMERSKSRSRSPIREKKSGFADEKRDGENEEKDEAALGRYLDILHRLPCREEHEAYDEIKEEEFVDEDAEDAWLSSLQWRETVTREEHEAYDEIKEEEFVDEDAEDAWLSSLQWRETVTREEHGAFDEIKDQEFADDDAEADWHQSDDDQNEDPRRLAAATWAIVSKFTADQSSSGSRPGKRSAWSPQEPSYPPRKKGRVGRTSKGRKSAGKGLEQFVQCSKVDVTKLRFSQLSCKDTFQCGRKVADLVGYLKSGEVQLDAKFLRLTVFDTTENGNRVLRCIDNRRLWALKAYQKDLKKPVFVYCSIYPEGLVVQCRRFLANSDDTDGRQVRMRHSQKQKHIKVNEDSA
ncbi:unnamed protein product, partial [Effrenium voratum]